MKLAFDLAGQRFGRLTVSGRSLRKSTAGALWECVCDCGGVTIADSLKLRTGHTASCGCLRAVSKPRTHGMACRETKTRTYRSWKEMRRRCLSLGGEKFKWYGGRGIRVCDRWADYAAFLADMGERPAGKTLDRIDVNGDYEPGNCRWATQTEQARNTRSNRLSLELADLLRADHALGLTFKELGEKYGISKTTAHRCAIGRTWTSQ